MGPENPVIPRKFEWPEASEPPEPRVYTAVTELSQPESLDMALTKAYSRPLRSQTFPMPSYCGRPSVSFSRKTHHF
jgi:hypothetical protein